MFIIRLYNKNDILLYKNTITVNIGVDHNVAN